MAITAFFKLFQPKDKVFYTLFEQMSDNLLEMSEYLVKNFENKDSINGEFLENIEKYEHENDRLTHEIFIQLGKNFITPFDREDINQLASAMDDIADFIYSSVKYVVRYKAPYIPAYLVLSKYIFASTKELKKAVYNFRDLKKPKEVLVSCVEINRLENEADDEFSKSLAELFENKQLEVLDIIKMKYVLENLEEVTDKCEDSANIIESILVKYA